MDYSGAERSYRRGSIRRATEGENFVTSFDKLARHCRTDEACGSGDEYAHLFRSLGSLDVRTKRKLGTKRRVVVTPIPGPMFKLATSCRDVFTPLCNPH